MSYKIAVASSDGIHVDWSFGAAPAFEIYSVTDEGYELEEIREYSEEEAGEATGNFNDAVHGAGGHCGCGGGCGGGGISPKVEMLSDVRCLVCSKIGFQAQKQFEKKAITTFDISCELIDALDQITGYFERLDHHESLRGWRQA